MKKVLLCFTLIVYVIASTGFALQEQFCMGEEVGTMISFTGEKDDHCQHCGMEKGDNICCSEKSSFVKITQAHQSSLIDIFFPVFVYTLPQLIAHPDQAQFSIIQFDVDAAPPFQDIPIYLSNRVFLI